LAVCIWKTILYVRISAGFWAAKVVAAKELGAKDRRKAVMHFMQPGA
jgi:hypothetical protein